MVDVRDLGSDAARTAAAGRVAAPTVAEIEAFVSRLGLDAVGVDDAERIDRIAALERLTCASQAAQHDAIGDFVVSQQQLAAERGVPAERRDQGLADQVALARRTSPHRGLRDVALALALRTDLPHTRAAFRSGRIDAFKVTLIARETAHLSGEHRAQVDQQLGADPEEISRLSPRRLTARLQNAAAELDPACVVRRRRRAEADRHVTLRPTPEVMTWLGALLPVKAGIAVRATLQRAALAAKASGDPRSIGQLTADILVHRVLNPGLAAQATTSITWASASELATSSPVPVTPAVPVTVNLIVRDTVLLGDAEGAGWVEGHGSVPGELIRQWIADNLDSGVGVWLRRVYERPATGTLVAMDSKAPFFAGGLAAFIRVRDRICRTVGCDAAVRHTDHIIPRARGGPTSADNGQGVCEHCNYAKEAPGWTARTIPGPRHTVETTTPTGHTYISTADPL